MLPVDTFRLAAHAGPYETWPLRTALLRDDGAPTGVRLPGYALRGQYRVGDDWLLVTDWDCPYEECTEVLLLDAALRVRARRRFGAMYASWLLDRAEVVSDDTLRLRFFGGDAATVQVVPPAWWTPWRRAPRLRVRADARLRPCRGACR
jgi:hypothetical protein